MKIYHLPNETLGIKTKMYGASFANNTFLFDIIRYLIAIPCHWKNLPCENDQFCRNPNFEWLEKKLITIFLRCFRAVNNFYEWGCIKLSGLNI